MVTLRRAKGVTLVEYGLAVMLIAIVAIGTLSALGGDVTDLFGGATSALGGSSSGSGSESFTDPNACAGGFEPGSLVAVSYGPIDGNPALPAGTLDMVTADSNGEITDCDPIVIPIEVPDGSYERDFSGTAPGGAPLVKSVPAVISSPDTDIISSDPPEPIEPTAGLMTMTVRVRDCSAVYLREEATMASPSTLHYPGETWEVYATEGWWYDASDNPNLAAAITGGTWPEYTCDGGSDNTWYQLTDGTGFVFTGGVDVIGGPYAGWPRHVVPDTTVPFTITTACEDAVFTFDGVSGEKYAWKYTGLAWTGDETVKRPNNTTFVGGHTAGNNHFHDTVTLDATGVFTITNGPRSCATGAGTLQIWHVPADASDTAVIGGDTGNITTTVRGQNASITFSGTAGQRVAYQASGSNLSNFHASLARPDSGSVFGSYRMSDGGGFKDVFTLPVTGTYRLNINPSGEEIGTASVTFWEVPADDVETLTLNGGSGTLDLTVAGQNGEFRFDGTAGQVVHWTYSGSLSGSNISSASLIHPNGATAMGGHTPSGTKTFTLTQTGTYVLRINAAGSATGTMTLGFTSP